MPTKECVMENTEKGYTRNSIHILLRQAAIKAPGETGRTQQDPTGRTQQDPTGMGARTYRN